MTREPERPLFLTVALGTVVAVILGFVGLSTGLWAEAAIDLVAAAALGGLLIAFRATGRLAPFVVGVALVLIAVPTIAALLVPAFAETGGGAVGALGCVIAAVYLSRRAAFVLTALQLVLGLSLVVSADDLELAVARWVNANLGVVFLVVLLTTLVAQRRAAIDALARAHARSEALLRNVLPDEIAARLKDEPTAIAEQFEAVTILFADIVGFTPLAARLAPGELVGVLDDLFSRFDALAERHGLEKIKTIGDAYLVVGGLPRARPDHAEAVAAMALDLREAVAAFRASSGLPLDVRIGIESGPVVAGVIGRRKFSYDLWGDAVNVAARMESHGAAGRIQLGPGAAGRLGGHRLEARGVIDVKGKGAMATWWLLGLVGCAGPPPCATPGAFVPGGGGNVVLVVLDDVGVDKVGAYGVHPSPAPTPNLDALASRGLRFTSAYGEPVCSSARAAMLTGRRPAATGIGSTVEPGGTGLSYAEVLLPEALARPAGAIGKWHLNLGDPQAPLQHGFDRFDGILDNPSDYRDWPHVVDGRVVRSTEYLVTAQADAAIAAAASLPEPWFLYVAFSGAHGPYHVPPSDLFSEADPSDLPGMGDAMIEALDHELGRLLDALGPDTTVILTSDNGTSSELVRPPADPRRAKSSVYAGGTHVPLIAAGPGIAAGVSDRLAHATDLFPTVLAIAGIDAADLDLELDGTSLAPLLYGQGDVARTCVFVEQFQPTGRPDLAVLDPGWTLVRHKRGPDELYRRDPLAPAEGADLAGSDAPGAQAALDRLRRQASAGR